ncbi:hypothetical protein EYF80_005142 [Liparis tanakae]|uniref:Rad21/Rec8-like protein C-terminal eukaryotic domain-containing protein n=1 Tax=Liparis tanakae TaxID=230148 RepID=A0A4Z2J3X8_9TELE|nr:hypothetical protein EYF80_005142 [Liparis tanakae]
MHNELKSNFSLEGGQTLEILTQPEKLGSDSKGYWSGQFSAAVDGMLDMSKEDKSVSDAITPASRWSPQEEAQLRMEPIAEENVDMPEAQTEAEDMLSWISSSLQRLGEVTFDSLMPPEADRSTAAHTLYKLLELLSARQVTAQQTDPFSDITINAAALRMTT